MNDNKGGATDTMMLLGTTFTIGASNESIIPISLNNIIFDSSIKYSVGWDRTMTNVKWTSVNFKSKSRSNNQILC